MGGCGDGNQGTVTTSSSRVGSRARRNAAVSGARVIPDRLRRRVALEELLPLRRGFPDGQEGALDGLDERGIGNFGKQGLEFSGCLL